MNTNTTAAPGRDEIEELLPWHAAGTLSRRDAARVEEALANDRELARRFDMVREEFAETIHLNETLGAPSSRAMERLMSGIEAEAGPARASKRRLTFIAWVVEQVSSVTPRTLAYTATVAALALVLQFGILTGVAVNTMTGPDAGFQTASRHPATAPVVTGTYALIGFSSSAAIGEINGFLETQKLTIVEGPRAGGLYRVRVSEKPLAPADAEARIAQLRGAGPLVSFAAAAE